MHCIQSMIISAKLRELRPHLRHNGQGVLQPTNLIPIWTLTEPSLHMAISAPCILGAHPDITKPWWEENVAPLSLLGKRSHKRVTMIVTYSHEPSSTESDERQGCDYFKAFVLVILHTFIKVDSTNLFQVCQLVFIVFKFLWLLT